MSEVAKYVVPVNIGDEMRSSYLDYAMSVIIGRALPDVRDGLKPVHRRVLYTMYQSKNFHNAPYKKSARIVGDVMGRFHPHGDAAIYDTIVRMAQDFNMRALLIDGQGNFGSVDGDAPAAMRYTEIRMTRLAEEMLQDIEKETVPMVPNYDGSEEEPTVLPTRIPNLLVNGSSGIAVGMSTSIPPHNLGEVIDGLIALANNPNITIEELMQHIPGPDFPTGAIIQGRSGIRSAYTTGKGSIKIKGRAIIEGEKKGRDRPAIIIKEIPYQVNKARLIERIAELHKDKRIEGIHDLRDESDREGMRVVIELKKDVDPNVVLNQLYTLTPLVTNFSVIMLAIVHGEPKILNLKEILEEFLQHRKDVVIRRSLFELRKAKEREHILLGYEIAIANLDEVIALIRASKNPEEARQGLCNRFQLSETQAKAILDLRLERLTRMEREKIIEELQFIQRQIADLNQILSSETRLMDVIKEELITVRSLFSDKRRTEIVEEEGEIAKEDLIPEEDVVVTRSAGGFIKRTPVSLYRSQRRGGKGKTGMITKDEDYIIDMFVASTHTNVLFFTSKGRVFRIKVYDLPEGSRQARGRAIVNFLNLAGDETVKAILPVKDFDSESYLVFVTKKGLVKKTEISLFKHIRGNGIIAIKLDPDDDLIAVRSAVQGQHCLLFSKMGKSIRFELDKIRPIGRDARGVKGMTLARGDSVVGLEVLEPQSEILAVSEKGYGKRTPSEEYRLQNRGGTGILAMRTNPKVGFIVGMRMVKPSDEILLTSTKGNMIRLKVDDISVMSRVTQGVRLMNLEGDERVATFDILAEKEEDNGVQENLPI